MEFIEKHKTQILVVLTALLAGSGLVFTLNQDGCDVMPESDSQAEGSEDLQASEDSAS